MSSTLKHFLSVDEALENILAAAPTLSAEDVALCNSTDRVLAENIVAKRTQPAANLSAMDGYALSSQALGGRAEFKIIGQSAAGCPFEGAVKTGEAVRIFTGAVVPKGCDQVVMQEYCSQAHNTLTVDLQNAPPRKGGNIRYKGTDFKHSACLLKAGTVLKPHMLGLVAAAGYGRIKVLKKPVVTIITTGDEIIQADSMSDTPAEDFQMVDSASPMVRALLEKHAGAVCHVRHAPDDLTAITTTLSHALLTSDFVVTIGGASVGSKDYMNQAMDDAGIKRQFWKIAMQPGKPLIFGHKGAVPVVGLPGNAISAFVCCFLFLVPLLRAAMGLPPKYMPNTAALTTSLPENGPRRKFLRATTATIDNNTAVTPLADQDSSLVSQLALAQALIIQPENSPEIPAGAQVQYLVL